MTDLGFVIMQLTGIIAPLLALSHFLRIFPRVPLVILFVIPVLTTLVLFFAKDMTHLVLVVDVALCTVVLFDLLTIPRKNRLVISRETGRVASIRKDHEVQLIVSNRARRSLFVSIRDSVPPELQPTPEEIQRRLAGQSRVSLSYTLKPSRRGAFEIGPIYVRVNSMFRLWHRIVEYQVPSTLHVYPDMKQLGDYELLARANRLSLLGVRRTRRVGEDHDFERLRDYTPDDNYKHIDWRTTARRRKLTVKQFQASQSQQIIFLLDCGRMMTGQVDGLSLLDHGLNAMLMMSYVALRQGDSVGMIAFSDEIHGFVPPGSGMRQINRLLHASFDRFPDLVESRYDMAFRYLASHCRKRSLVVLVTNLIDEVNAQQIETYMTNMVGRHLPMSVLLRDHHLFDAVADEDPRGDLIYPAAAAAEILTWRHQVLTDLQNKGVLALDVFPEQMTAPLVNRYLEIKARHLL